MKEIVATVTSKGQITLPIEIRKKLRLSTGDAVTFVITDEGKIELRAPIYPTVASLRGAAGSLATPLSWEEMRAIAREDQANAAHSSATDSET
jgi:antitoxin PrlF